MPSIQDEINQKALEWNMTPQNRIRVLPEDAARAICEARGADLGDVYRAALKFGVWPERYSRNTPELNIDEQLRLSGATVGIVGAGGLGGQVFLQLLRLGIGGIVLVDPDDFSASNLNRQALAALTGLGRSKVRIARQMAAQVNPGTEVRIHPEKLTLQRGADLLQGAGICVDALDNIQSRRDLWALCRRLEIPMVHGAVDGGIGRVMLLLPDTGNLDLLYGAASPADKDDAGSGKISVIAPAAAVVASFQVMETLKSILGRDNPLENRMMHIDLWQAGAETFLF